MGNLHALSSKERDPRPFHHGFAEGVKNHLPVTQGIEWLVDTGANVSARTASKAALFDLTLLGGAVFTTTGGGGMVTMLGVTMVFSVLDATGTDQQVRCSLPIAVNPTTTAATYLGWTNSLTSTPKCAGTLVHETGTSTAESAHRCQPRCSET
jgi:hypothetical protein